MIRDETARVIVRARARQARAAEVSPTTPPKDRWINENLTILGPQRPLPNVAHSDSQNQSGSKQHANITYAEAQLSEEDFLGLYQPNNADTFWYNNNDSQGLMFPEYDTDFSDFTPLPPVLSYSLSDLGTNYFVANYVTDVSDACPPGVFNYVSSILGDYAGDIQLAQAAIQAVGLAGIATSASSGAEGVMRVAFSSYSDAVRRINSALSDPVAARNDSTIFAAMIMGIFEGITCSTEASMEAWGHHINGVANLVIHRGASQLNTKTGFGIFNEAFSQIITLCARYRRPVPPQLRYFFDEMGRRMGAKLPSRMLSTYFGKVMDLHARIKPVGHEGFEETEWKSLVLQAVELDENLDAIFARVPPAWQFEKVVDPLADPTLVYKGRYDLYQSVWVAKVYNGMRTCRVLLNQSLYTLVVKKPPTLTAAEPVEGLPKPYSSLSQHVVTCLMRMRNEILASVPQILGHLSPGYKAGMTSPVPAAGPYAVLWHVYLAGGLPVNSPETRQWAINKLHEIRKTTGIRKATYFAHLLETNSEFDRSSSAVGSPEFQLDITS